MKGAGFRMKQGAGGPCRYSSTVVCCGCAYSVAHVEPSRVGQNEGASVVAKITMLTRANNEGSQQVHATNSVHDQLNNSLALIC